MKKILRVLISVGKWTLLALVAVEVLSFLAISLSNYIVFGDMREGSRFIYDPYTLILNKEGIRPTVHNAANPNGPNHRTIWMFGGSTMRGSTEHDDRTIPSYLASLLNRPDSFLTFTIHNFGVDSFNSLMESKYLQKELIENRIPPDLIIFYDGANDSTYFPQYRTPYGHLGYRRMRGLIEGYRGSFLGLFKPLTIALHASFTKECLDKLRLVAAPLEPDSPLLKDDVTKTAQRYNYVRKVAACYGAQFLLFWQPILWVETWQAPDPVRREEEPYAIWRQQFQVVRHNISLVYRTLAARLQSEPYFVDFQNVLCPRSRPVYKSDGVHLNDAGRLRVAQAMSRVLKERGFLATKP
jgi:hypothetical protein